ncbi:IclR family transcriptional regulator [Paracoccus sp. (in: a-proteobacteria)]|uniref:IclR family transcriptional regulator n=1 Tax=Paracoccus sp. TaxID=267 RepID=UPI0026E0A9E2|nr:helix-turn-helix domain-containing protein [Paracoccus sp. (in: a-proteobacteria)]MDO5370928.1 helix-turn-helix domain-containing protein [Paracoccus sp. (in: a-proteobacteria)]
MTEPNDPRFATTLARGLSVLRAFRVTDDGLSNAEIAQRTGLPKSTVSRLTFTLGQLGYLVQSPRDDRFRPGPTLVAVGHVAAASLSFLVPAHELMQRLAEETGTLVVLAVRDGDKLVLIRTWRPTRVASIWLEVGQRIPLQPFSSWRAFIAAARPGEIGRIAAERLPGRDALQALLDDRPQALADMALQGFISTPAGSGMTAAYNAVSVPFRSGNLAEPVVFTCGALPAEASVERMETEVGPRLAAAVRTLERLTGQASGPVRMEA